MNSTAKIIIVLTLITVISGGVLAVLDSFTKPRIEAYQEKIKNEAVADVLPKNIRLEKVEIGEKTYYKANANGNILGYAFEVSGGGYQSELIMMVGVTPDFSEIIAAKIISQVETPGLGTKIETDPSNKEHPGWFMDQFKGLKIDPAITYVKNAKPSKKTEIEAITGATISSAAIVNILNKEIKKAKADMLTEGKIEKKEPKMEDILSVLPENVKIRKIEKNDQIVYEALKGNTVVAYAFEASCEGYQSEISLLIAVTKDFSEILDLKVIAQSETPGWGTKIENDTTHKTNPCWFVEQFRGVKTEPEISFVKNAKPTKNSEVEAISGATISSAAIVGVLNEEIKSAKAVIGK